MRGSLTFCDNIFNNIENEIVLSILIRVQSVDDTNPVMLKFANMNSLSL